MKVPGAGPILELREVSKWYAPGPRSGAAALDRVSLIIPCGAFTLVSGPSGSGKTTLLSLMGLLDRPSTGQVFFEGTDLSSASEPALARFRRRIGFVFQNFSLIRGLPVWENITCALVPRGMSRRERHRRARLLLERLALADRLTALPAELSGGEQQRVAMARALVGEPDVILADEPTSNVDAETAQTVMSELRRAWEAGCSVVVASHEPLIAQLATQRVALERGKLIESGGTS